MTKDAWKRPDTIDSIEKFVDLTNDDLRDTMHWAKENRDSYIELISLVKRELNWRERGLRKDE